VCVGTRACVCSCICAVSNNFFCRAAPLYVDCLETISVLILRRKVGKTPAPLCLPERAVFSLLKCCIDF